MIDTNEGATSDARPSRRASSLAMGRRAWDKRKGFVMFKLRYAAAVLMAAGMTGCVTFCDECDDFPIPGGYAALPGTYTGPPVTHGGESQPGTTPDQTAKPFRRRTSLCRRPLKRPPRRRTP